MKIKKIVEICKRSGAVRLLMGDDGVQWLGDGVACYPLENAPIFDEESLCTAFDITDKQKEAIFFSMEAQLPSGICFESTCSGEQVAERNDISLVYKGDTWLVFSSPKGALYMKAKYLSPVMADRMEIYLRETEDGVPYFVCKLGWAVQAIIMPAMFEKSCREFVSALDLVHEQSMKRREK